LVVLAADGITIEIVAHMMRARPKYLRNKRER